MKPWFGITPPPRGWGYYPEEWSQPGLFPDARSIARTFTGHNSYPELYAVIRELQHQLDELTGYEPPRPAKKTIEEMREHLLSIRKLIDDLKADL